MVDSSSMKPSPSAPPSKLVAEVLAGRIASIARLISLAEAGEDHCRLVLAEIYRHTGRAAILGITGVPGSGKSTLIGAMIQQMRSRDRKIAVVAIDPTSPFSGGAILGDRIRMSAVADDPGVFIRSMATRGALGGLAPATLDAVDILDAAGFDLVIIETVGVGQDEVDVVKAAHTTVVISAPGLGDDIQAIKAGILEIADIHVVSKCDRADANKTINDLKQMLMLDMSDPAKDPWSTPVIATSANTGQGVTELIDTIDQHRNHLNNSNQLAQRQQRIARIRTIKIAESILRKRFAAQRAGACDTVIQNVCARQIDPYSAAVELLAAFNGDSNK